MGRQRRVREGGASVPRNVREPSEEVLTPRGRDVDGPHRNAAARKARQEGHLLKSQCHLTDGEVERVRLEPPPVDKYAHEG